MKKLFTAVLSIMLFSMSVHPIQADNHSVLEDFLIPLFSSDDSVRVLCDEKDLTDQYIREWEELYLENRIDDIRQSIINHNLDLVLTRIITPKTETREAINGTKTVQREFYECKPNTTSHPDVVKEWKTQITASILYSRETGEVKQVWGTISATNINFGTAFSVHMSNVSTSTYINSAKTYGRFTGSYKLTGTFAELPLYYNVSFGPVSRSVTIYSPND